MDTMTKEERENRKYIHDLLNDAKYDRSIVEGDSKKLCEQFYLHKNAGDIDQINGAIISHLESLGYDCNGVEISYDIDNQVLRFAGTLKAPEEKEEDIIAPGYYQNIEDTIKECCDDEILSTFYEKMLFTIYNVQHGRNEYNTAYKLATLFNFIRKGIVKYMSEADKKGTKDYEAIASKLVGRKILGLEHKEEENAKSDKTK